MATMTVRREDATEELRRFLELAGDLGSGLEMFSEFVDAAWHSLLEDASAYEAFCAEAGGTVFDHDPSGSDGLRFPIEWIGDYEARWGMLPVAWFTRVDGTVDTDAYRHYLDSHEVVASWDCTPGWRPLPAPVGDRR